MEELWRLTTLNHMATCPTEDMLRKEYLGKGVAAPDLTMIKDFIRFYIATSPPRAVRRPYRRVHQHRG